jgi:hypothetical protein
MEALDDDTVGWPVSALSAVDGVPLSRHPIKQD